MSPRSTRLPAGFHLQQVACAAFQRCSPENFGAAYLLKQDSDYHAEPFVLVSRRGRDTNLWVGLVGQPMIRARCERRVICGRFVLP